MNVMTQTTEPAVSLGEKGLTLPISDRSAYFNYYWLRDNCPSSFSSATRERGFDIFHLDAAPVAASVVTTESSTTRPSSLPRIDSQARSGCGMSPTTFRFSLHTPAIASSDPFGLENSDAAPSWAQ